MQRMVFAVVYLRTSLNVTASQQHAPKRVEIVNSTLTTDIRCPSLCPSEREIMLPNVPIANIPNAPLMSDRGFFTCVAAALILDTPCSGWHVHCSGVSVALSLPNASIAACKPGFFAQRHASVVFVFSSVRDTMGVIAALVPYLSNQQVDRSSLQAVSLVHDVALSVSESTVQNDGVSMWSADVGDTLTAVCCNLVVLRNVTIASSGLWMVNTTIDEGVRAVITPSSAVHEVRRYGNMMIDPQHIVSLRNVLSAGGSTVVLLQVEIANFSFNGNEMTEGMMRYTAAPTVALNATFLYIRWKSAPGQQQMSPRLFDASTRLQQSDTVAVVCCGVVSGDGDVVSLRRSQVGSVGVNHPKLSLKFCPPSDATRTMLPPPLPPVISSPLQRGSVAALTAIGFLSWDSSVYTAPSVQVSSAALLLYSQCRSSNTPSYFGTPNGLRGAEQQPPIGSDLSANPLQLRLSSFDVSDNSASPIPRQRSHAAGAVVGNVICVLIAAVIGLGYGMWCVVRREKRISVKLLLSDVQKVRCAVLEALYSVGMPTILMLVISPLMFPTLLCLTFVVSAGGGGSAAVALGIISYPLIAAPVLWWCAAVTGGWAALKLRGAAARQTSRQSLRACKSCVVQTCVGFWHVIGFLADPRWVWHPAGSRALRLSSIATWQKGRRACGRGYMQVVKRYRETRHWYGVLLVASTSTSAVVAGIPLGADVTGQPCFAGMWCLVAVHSGMTFTAVLLRPYVRRIDAAAAPLMSALTVLTLLLLLLGDAVAAAGAVALFQCGVGALMFVLSVLVRVRDWLLARSSGAAAAATHELAFEVPLSSQLVALREVIELICVNKSGRKR